MKEVEHVKHKGVQNAQLYQSFAGTNFARLGVYRYEK